MKLLILAQTIFAVVAGPQQQSPPSTIYFLCNNLASIPALMGVNCPGNINISSATVGQTLYIGLNSSKILHVSGFPVTCNGCVQDIFPFPGINEYPIATYTVGQGMKYTWTGFPALPSINVWGCASYYIIYAPGNITVNCIN